MALKREEIMSGVWLNHIQSDRFKTADLAFVFLTQLDRETAFMNALIPAVLTRGTVQHPDLEALGNRMDELYSADISPLVRLSGEIQCTGISVSYPEPKYLPVSRGYTKDVVDLAAEVLLRPLTRGGLLWKEYVDSEKEKLADNIRALINEKGSYAVERCMEEMCCYESFAVGKLGKAEDSERVNYTKLTKQYRNILTSAPLEILYCGSESFEAISSYLQDALMTMPRGDIDFDLGTDIRMNAVEETARYVEEQLNVTQGKLVIGFRLGEWMNDPDPAVLSIFNCLYGCGVTSKLFRNVREKLHLCYYASSAVRLGKGVMFVTSGIDFDNFEQAKHEILFQLDEIRNGNFTDEELEWARAGVRSDLRTIPDSSGSLLSYYFSRLLTGTVMSTEEYITAAENVTREQIINLARSVVPDMVYFLRNDPDDAEADGETEEQDE